MRWTAAIIAVFATLFLPTSQHSRAAQATRCPTRNLASGSVTVSGFFQGVANAYQTGPSGFPPFFSSYFGLDNHGSLFPELATEVPTLRNGGIRDGGKTIVVHLKKGTYWSNGAEITSADAKFGWKIDSDPLTGPACNPTCVLTSVDTPDRYTVVFHLKHPYSAVLYAAMPTIWPTKWAGSWNGDPHVAANVLTNDPTFDFLGPRFPTNGPYQVASATPNGTTVVMRPMKYYTVMNCGAYINRLILKTYATPAQKYADVVSRKLDIAADWNPSDLVQLEQHRASYHIHVVPSSAVEFLELNQDATYLGKQNPLHDVRVRQALALSLNRLNLIQNTVGLNQQQARSVVQWSFLLNTHAYQSPFADRSITGQWDPISRRFDPNTGQGTALRDAKTLLSRTRWGRGFSVDFVTTAGNPVRQAEEESIARAWAKLGITVNATYVPPGTFFGLWDQGGILDHGAFQIGLLSIGGLDLDPDTYAQALDSHHIDRNQNPHRRFNTNYAGIQDPVIDRAFGTAAATFDKKVRRSAFDAIQQHVNRNADWLGLYARSTVYTEDGRVSSVSDSVDSYSVYWNPWSWRVQAPKRH